MLDYSQAQEYLSTALQSAIKHELPREEALAYEFLGDLERALGKTDEAGEYYRKGMEISERIAPRTLMTTELGRRIADWHIDRGEYTEARAELEQALEIALEIGDKREEAILYRVKARLIVATNGRVQSAEAALKKSIEIMGGMGARYEEALSRAALGRLKVGAPRKGRATRLEGVDDLCAAAATFGELELSERQAELLIETVELGEGVLEPHDSLGMLHEAEIALRPLRRNRNGDGGRADKMMEKIASLRTEFETEIARRATNTDPEPIARGGNGNDDSHADRLLRSLSRRLSAKKAFLYLRRSLEGPRTLGCCTGDALPALERLAFSPDKELIVSAGDLTGEGSECYGPFVAYQGFDSEGVVYMERALGSKPFTEQEAAEFAACSARLLRRIPPPVQGEGDGVFPRVVTRNSAMRDLIDRIAFLRNSSASVLMRGETGTGKGLFAHLLHDLGDRARTGSFVQVHCAEFPETLIESELFGHVRGAFTGAFTSKQGLVEKADGGTLFLDEVGDLSPTVQLRLLRVIEEKRLKRVGEARDREVDIRIIAATHRNLEMEIERDNFREDLYYRLNVVTLIIPPLRDRREDVPLLAEHFLSLYASAEGKSAPGVSAETMRRLKLYSWPGNVRELQNEIRRLVAILPAGASIQPSDLSERILHNGKASRFLRRPGQLSFQEQENNLQDALDSLEQEWIREALIEAKGKAKATARILGISPQLLHYKMKKYDFAAVDLD